MISGLIAPSIVKSQNLVPNPSFEVMDSCPDNQNQVTRLKHWYKFLMDSPDLMSACSINASVSVPSNVFGYQQAYSDSSYIVIGTGNKNSICCGREYVSVKLLEALERDSFYCVGMHISVADVSELFNNGLGVVFDSDSIYYNQSDYPIWTPSVRFSAMINDTANWVYIESLYQAQGGEQFMSIGNFLDGNTISWVGDTTSVSILYIDDVSVSHCSIPPDTVATTNYISVYPNPSRSVVSLDYGVISDKQGRFEMYDYAGKLAFELDDLRGKYENTFALPQLSSGIYLWRFWVGDAIIETWKLVILKE